MFFFINWLQLMHDIYCTKIPLSGVFLLRWFRCRHWLCMTFFKRPDYHGRLKMQYVCRNQVSCLSSHPWLHGRLLYWRRPQNVSGILTGQPWLMTVVNVNSKIYQRYGVWQSPYWVLSTKHFLENWSEIFTFKISSHAFFQNVIPWFSNMFPWFSNIFPWFSNQS